MTDFVSLHNHTHFSILDSLISPKDLFNRAKELGQKAVAVTDHGSLAAAWDSLKASKSTGVKLIIGCEMYFLDDVKKTDQRFRHVILLAKNAIGYKNLLTLNKEGFDNSIIAHKRVYPVIDWTLLEKYKEGLICLTSCSNGILAQLLMNKKYEEAVNQLHKLINIFGENLGLEVQANTLKRGSNTYNDVIEQVYVNRQIINLAKKFNVRCVATTNSHYLKKEDAQTHDVLLAIGSHQTIYSNFRLKYDSPDFYLKTGDEVKAFFERNYGEYAEELCKNTVYFADLCEEPDWIDPKYSNPSGKELPIFPVKDEPDYQEFLNWLDNQSEYIKKIDIDKQYLRYKCEKNFDDRLPNLDKNKLQEYKDRITEELEVFEFHSFSSYMLIVSDFINWARKNNIRVGVGRGSVGGSLIGYLLNIHQADPIKYNLIFARFHNKEKQSYPDCDIDFSSSGRERVKTYIKNKYGNDHVAYVSNVNTITPKVYIKDIARVCELGGSKDAAVKLGNDIADCISKDIHSIEEAIEKVPLFSEYTKKYPEFIKYAEICGKYRANSVHAGGIIVSARPLTGLVPLRKDKDGNWAIEYDKDRAEENGLVKIDTLCVSSLDDIDLTLDLIKQSGKELDSNYNNYDFYDEKTYELISNGDTFKVFQLGTSGGTIDLCRRVKPKNINDIANINALARPSAKDMRNDFIATRNGKKAFKLIHPNLARAFNNTYGFGLYEESLMYLAQDIAGWSLHSADRLRKLTKEKGKNPEKAKKLRLEFINDSINNGISEEIATKIWDEIINNFQGYGFNSSHAIFYSMTGFTTAFLKSHYPLEFLLAALIAEVKSNSPDAKKNIDKIKKEIRQINIKINPPNINTSDLNYSIRSSNQLLTGLDALKFVSDDAIKDIISKRPFKDFFDFMVRVSSKYVRANAIQALAASGSLDSFNIPRKLIYLYVSDYRKKLQTWLKKHDPLTEEFNYPWPNESEWSKPELYALEQFYLGEGFSCGKVDAYGSFFKDPNLLTIGELKKLPDKTKIPVLKIEIKDFFEFKVKKEKSKYQGKPMIKASVEDVNGEQCGLTIFPDKWEELQNKLKKAKITFDKGVVLSFAGSVNIYEDEFGIILDNIYDFKPPPQVPKDLTAKKVVLKPKKDKPKDPKSNPDLDSLIEEIEDDLYDEGLIDYDENDIND